MAKKRVNGYPRAFRQMALERMKTCGNVSVLTAWTLSDTYFNNPVEARITHVTLSGLSDYTLPFNSWPIFDQLGMGKETMVLGENGMAFATDGTKIVAFDISSGTVNWTWQPPQGTVQMIMATAGNGLIAKNRDDATSLETVVRLDSSGSSTYDGWSKASIQYVASDLWLSQGSVEAISATEADWPDSTWPQPNNNGLRGAEPVIRVRVYKINEANIDDALIRSRVGSAIEYWQKKAGVLMDWDRNILPVPACAEDRPGCVQGSNPAHEYDITSITNLTNVAEAVRRFRPSASLNLLFVYTVGYAGNIVDAGVPLDASAGGYTNLVLVSHDSKDVLAHELGHVFQLEHEPLRPFNLMYGSCPVIPFVIPCLFTDIANALADSNSLNQAQILKARASARKLAP